MVCLWGCRASGEEGGGEEGVDMAGVFMFLYSSLRKGGVDRNTGITLYGKRIQTQNALSPFLEPLNELSKGRRGKKGRVRSIYKRQVVDVHALFGALFGTGG